MSVSLKWELFEQALVDSNFWGTVVVWSNTDAGTAAADLADEAEKRLYAAIVKAQSRADGLDALAKREAA